MSLSRESAFDILGLPTFATFDEIVLRYKSLALRWFPEGHSNPELALQEFTNITEATIKLLFPNKATPRKLTLPEMYGFFQLYFFGNKGVVEEEHLSDEDGSENSIPFEVAEAILEEKETQADDNAHKLIVEEELEKQKAEKRKAKKKRRKEKKKLEKIAKESSAHIVGGGSLVDNKVVKDNRHSTQTSPQDSESDSDEELDSTSAFVAGILKKHVKEQQTFTEDMAKSLFPQFSNIPRIDPLAIISSSRQLALRGNELASTGFCEEAVDLFTEAIQLNPSDYRFYGNRSYCYERLGKYESALKDAEKSIVLSPSWPKGYYRKGRALLGLKKYAVAEQCFVDVINRDADCEDAVSELQTARVCQIMERGYTKDVAEAALTRFPSVQEALAGLTRQGLSRLQVKDDLEVFMSDDESSFSVKSSKKPKPQQVVQQPQQPYDIKTDPNNPENHNSLWIGNVQPEVTEKKLYNMFSKYGELLSVKVMPEKFCAFVNFKHKNSPGSAMKAYQGFELSGGKLLIRFPNLPGDTPSTSKKKPVIKTATESKTLGPVNGDECFFWRNAGCTLGKSCRYKHIKEHKGIDKKKK